MRKQISVAILLLAFSFVIVGAHFTEVKENDSGKLTVVKQAEASHFDAMFINDAVVPVVQSNHLTHIESVSFISEGYAPMKERKARAPNSDRTNLSPLPRDKPFRG